MKVYRVGIDVGSTTVKLVVLGADNAMIFGAYRRHMAHVQDTLLDLLLQARERLGECQLRVKITGSGAISLSEAMHIGFVQEVVAVSTALRAVAPQTDVAIELGGEDAKIIYFTGGLEQRMNGVCAGGTGAFIDQMAALLQTDAAGLNDAARDYHEIYPIAARCGVFAKSDIQPLINEGATKADLAASIFQAVVNQTISGLACGKPIRGCVAFLGGPLHFLPELKRAFIRTLRLTPQTTVDPADSHLFAATGSALEAADAQPIAIGAFIDQLRGGIHLAYSLKRLPPLFTSPEEYEQFRARHAKATVKKADLASYKGGCYLGIDAGSTTTKLALIGQEGQLLWSFYANNQGSPLKTAIQALTQLEAVLPPDVAILRACSTGYGETLMQSAFNLDDGEVETVAHYHAAAFFRPDVDCILDIGGQDMKCIKIKNHCVDTILLNEACSSGCGSFLENFANSLGYQASEFAELALFAKQPIDLGTRCTVFMNSNVKQAQKEGACVEDIAAGLAYSVIKNALFKVIKLTDAKALGQHVVFQGGMFYNQAVLRAAERIAGIEAICPDISGIMGAFGAALIAKSRYRGQPSSMLPLAKARELSYVTATTRCGGCSNHCMLTINRFSGGRRHISGNRCEKGLGLTKAPEKGPNVSAYKFERMFAYPPLPPEQAPMGVIGIPRVLNLYEDYPFWATFFRQLGFRVILSPMSSRKIYELGMESIPSESECYPAKMAHGHVQWLVNQGIRTVFYPCVLYEHQEVASAQNHYNCPIVASYPENLKNNVDAVTDGTITYIRPFLAFTSEKIIADRLVRLCEEQWDLPEKVVRQAVHLAWAEQRQAKADVRAKGQEALDWMREHGRKGIVLAGRPYHIDPEIHHGIPDLIASYRLAVLTEDSLPIDFEPSRPLRANDQWVYHSRLYTAAEFVGRRDDLELVQLNSFGCGLDAVTCDQVSDILARCNKLYTTLKIDEVNSLGAARIRIRSLLAAMDMREQQGIRAKPQPIGYHRAVFTKQMRKEGYTILAPQMSPIHFDILQPIFTRFGYHVEILDNDNRAAIDTGLKFVNNDACFPSIITVGQIMSAVLSGKYDTNKLAIAMTQTGGCCRASNYVGFIRRALERVGLGHIPVISINANGMEKNPGFRASPQLLYAAARALVYGDLFMRCVYRTRPYEAVPGSANALHEKWRKICIEQLTDPNTKWTYAAVCQGIVADFDALPLIEGLRKPRVGVVGEILVKYMPLANNHLVDLLEREGAEAVVPDLMDFLNYCVYNNDYKHEYLGFGPGRALIARLGVSGIRAIRMPAIKALEASARFEAPMPIEQVGELAKPYLSLGNQYGEGWFLTGEMVELIQSDVPNIICIQPFACLPNHVVGKGVIKILRRDFPQANIVAVDYDPGASEVNQLNRIKLMLSAAKKALANSGVRVAEKDRENGIDTSEKLLYNKAVI